MELVQNLSKEVGNSLTGGDVTVQDIIEYLIRSKLVSPARSRQFLAVKEFFEQYGSDRKTAIIKRLSVKYQIAEKTLWHIIDSRRFLV